MGFYIYAWLDDANPRLQIIDAQSGSICVSWSYRGVAKNGVNKNRDTDKNEIKRLFRDLILLTCQQEMNNSRIFKAGL